MTEAITPFESDQSDEAGNSDVSDIGRFAIGAANRSPEFTPQFEYAVLIDRRSPEYSNALRTHYIRLTQRLINTIEGNGDPTARPDYVLFLDKSARPVAWFTQAFWPLLAEKAPGDPIYQSAKSAVPPRPDFKFLNIDRDQWRPIVGDQETGVIDVSRVPQSDIDELRAIFIAGKRDRAKALAQQPTLFDDKKVLIVDEVRVSSDTLVTARKLLERAFPSARFKGTYWMVPEVKSYRGGEKMPTDMPVWYNEKDITGRGVGNRLETSPTRLEPKSRLHKGFSDRQISGWRFLSTRPGKLDEKSGQLRQEIIQLAKEYQANLSRPA